MSLKTAVWIGVFVGGTVGSFVPFLWGGGLIASVLWSSIGGAAGIYVAYKLFR